MKPVGRQRRSRGFALVLTLALLALLVLTVAALSVLVRTGSQVADSAARQVQARQHALLGLSLALGELQRQAGPDTRITGMAGIAGVPPGAGSGTRYWCGVWRDDGSFAAWLVSGAGREPSLTSPAVEVVSAGSVGAATSTSSNVEKEHVVAGLIPVEMPGSFGAWRGNYAFVVIDEGVKISAYAPPAQRADPNLAPAIGGKMLQNQLKLKAAIDAGPAKLPKILAYEQLAFLPTPAADPLTPSVLQDTFHYVTLTSRTVAAGQLRAGTVNINTASALVWRSLLDVYSRIPGATPIPPGDVDSKGNEIGNGFASATAGKSAGGPFTSVAGLVVYLETAGVFPAGGTPTASQFVAALGPLLAVRSDTFRIRAYGDAANSATGGREAAAYCEAVVQRTPEVIDATLGRRFVITSFRWLAPDDI